MDRVIHWKAWLKTSSPKNAGVLMSRVSKALNERITIAETVPDRKKPGRYQSTFTTVLAAEGFTEATLHARRLAGRLAHGWTVRPPQEYEGGRWDFAGWSEKRTRLSGVEALEFEIRNYD